MFHIEFQSKYSKEFLWSPCQTKNSTLKEVKLDQLEPTLDTLGQITQVKDVVRFGGGGEEVGRHPAVNLHGSLTNRFCCLTHGRGEVHEKPSQDLLQKN